MRVYRADAEVSAACVSLQWVIQRRINSYRKGIGLLGKDSFEGDVQRSGCHSPLLADSEGMRGKAPDNS